MSRYTNNSAKLPLFEAVLAVAVFVLVSTVLLRLYMSADRLQGEAVAVSKAMILAENAAERFAHDGTASERTGFTDSFEEARENIRYELTVQTNQENGLTNVLKNALISVRDVKSGKVLCELKASFIAKE